MDVFRYYDLQWQKRRQMNTTVSCQTYPHTSNENLSSSSLQLTVNKQMLLPVVSPERTNQAPKGSFVDERFWDFYFEDYGRNTGKCWQEEEIQIQFN